MTPRFLAWCLVLSASVFKCADSFSLSAFSPTTNTSVLSWLSWRKFCDIHTFISAMQFTRQSIELLVVGCYRNIELGVICIAMIIDALPPNDTTKG